MPNSEAPSVRGDARVPAGAEQARSGGQPGGRFSWSAVAGLLRREGAALARGWDGGLLLCVLLLTLLGTVAIASASAPLAGQHYGDSLFFFRRRLVHIVLGVLALLGGAFAPAWLLRRSSGPLLVLCVLLLGATLLPGVGIAAGGAQRWLGFGPLRLQPVELLKPALLLLLAHHLALREDTGAGFWQQQARPLAWAGIALLLVLLQPDFGGVVLLAAAVFVLFFLAGVRLGQLGLAALCTGGLLLALAFSQPYRVRRLAAFLDPWADRLDSGFQIVQSYLALGGGGWLGLGLGASRQKQFFLPDAHTDFIFSIWGEETGFVGVLGLLGLFGCFFWRAYRLCGRLEGRFPRLFGLGLATMLALQMFMHLFVAMGLLPAKGLPLPFVSYGGSSLIATLLMAGLLLGLGRSQALGQAAPNAAVRSAPQHPGSRPPRLASFATGRPARAPHRRVP